MLDQPRSTQRYEPLPAEDEQILTDDIVELTSRFGKYGYRRITALLRHRGWDVNHKRVERIWRWEGLKVPSKQLGKARLWLNGGSCVRLRPNQTEPRVGLRLRPGQDLDRKADEADGCHRRVHQRVPSN